MNAERAVAVPGTAILKLVCLDRRDEARR